MSVVSPWGFGINREEIGILCRELVLSATGLPADRVFIVDQAARTPRAPRPYCGIEIGDHVLPSKAGGDTRIFPTKEQWLVTVTDASDGAYTVTVQGTDYDFTASSNTIEEIRDGLLAAMGSPSQWTPSAVGTDQIQIDSTVDGLRLNVLTSPASLTATRVTANLQIWDFNPAELQVNISCDGFMDYEAPDATQNGQSIADQVQYWFENRLLNEKLRNCGHCPTAVRRILLPGLLEREQQSLSIVQIILRTTARLAVQTGNIDSIAVEPVATQI
jgi:hypothetical protein